MIRVFHSLSLVWLSRASPHSSASLSSHTEHQKRKYFCYNYFSSFEHTRRLNGEKREWIIIKLLCIGRKINSKNICSTNRLILLICSICVVLWIFLFSTTFYSLWCALESILFSVLSVVGLTSVWHNFDRDWKIIAICPLNFRQIIGFFIIVFRSHSRFSLSAVDTSAAIVGHFFMHMKYSVKCREFLNFWIPFSPTDFGGDASFKCDNVSIAFAFTHLTAAAVSHPHSPPVLIHRDHINFRRFHTSCTYLSAGCWGWIWHSLYSGFVDNELSSVTSSEQSIINRTVSSALIAKPDSKDVISVPSASHHRSVCDSREKYSEFSQFSHGGNIFSSFYFFIPFRLLLHHHHHQPPPTHSMHEADKSSLQSRIIRFNSLSHRDRRSEQKQERHQEVVRSEKFTRLTVNSFWVVDRSRVEYKKCVKLSPTPQTMNTWKTHRASGRLWMGK